MQANAQRGGKYTWAKSAEDARDESGRYEKKIESLIAERRRKQRLHEENDGHEGQRPYVDRRMWRPRPYWGRFSSVGASRIHDGVSH